MRFPFSMKPGHQAAAFAILNVAAAALLLLCPAAPTAARAVLLAVSSLFFVLWNTLFYISIYREIDNNHKMRECLKLNDSYKRQIDELRARQHDMKNQLAVIRGMLEHGGAPCDISTLVQDAGMRLDESSMLLKLNNSAIGMVLYNKYQQAREKGMELAFKNLAADLSCDPGQLYDLTAILGTIIDNAIESSDAGDRITVEIGEIESFLYFSVINRGNIPCNDIEKLFSPGYSSKGADRGFGLSNVRSAVMKHGGNIELTADGDRIECRVYFPISA